MYSVPSGRPVVELSLGLSSGPIHGVNAHGLVLPFDFSLEGHAGFFGNAAGGGVLRVDEGDEAAVAEGDHSMVEAAESGLGGEALAPEIAAQVVADLDLRHAVHRLRHQPAVADAFARGTQDHRLAAKSDAFCSSVFRYRVVTSRNRNSALQRRHPALHPRLIKRSRIKPHDFRVAENAQQRRNFVRGHPAQVEAWGFEDC